MARKKKTKTSPVAYTIVLPPLDIEKAKAEEARLDKEILKLSEELKEEEEDPIDPETCTEAELRAALAKLEEECPTMTGAETQAYLAKLEEPTPYEAELQAAFIVRTYKPDVQRRSRRD